jgi:hypothetical protein
VARKLEVLVTEIAERFGVSRQGVHRWIANVDCRSERRCPTSFCVGQVALRHHKLENASTMAG